MQQFVMNMEPSLVKEIDALVKKEKLYSSRNEFVRDAVRSKILEYRRALVRTVAKQLAEKARSRGWDGRMPTRGERDAFAEKYMKAIYPKEASKVHVARRRELALATAESH